MPVVTVVIVIGGGGNWRSEIGDERYKAHSNSKMLPGLGQETWCRHEFPPEHEAAEVER